MLRVSTRLIYGVFPGVIVTRRSTFVSRHVMVHLTRSETWRRKSNFGSRIIQTRCQLSATVKRALAKATRNDVVSTTPRSLIADGDGGVLEESCPVRSRCVSSTASANRQGLSGLHYTASGTRRPPLDGARKRGLLGHHP